MLFRSQVCAGDPDSEVPGVSWAVYACSPECEGRVNRLDGTIELPELMLHTPDAAECIKTLKTLRGVVQNWVPAHPEALTEAVRY